MRKVFSYFVLALCLIVSTQVKATKVAELTIGGVTTDIEDDLFPTLADISEMQNPKAIIKLVQNANMNCPALPDRLQGDANGNKKNDRTWINNGAEITFDLNGFTLTTDLRINLVDAKVYLRGKGTYKANITQCFTCYGSYSNLGEGAISSYVYVGSGVTIDATGYDYAFGIMQYKAYDSSKEHNYINYNTVIDVYGKVKANQAIGLSGNLNTFHGSEATLNIHPSAIVEGSNELKKVDKSWANGSDEQKTDWAAVRKSNETPYEEGHDGDADFKYYYTSGAAIYAAGCINVNIEGTVLGGVGVYIKAGHVTFNNATVMATAAQQWDPINHGNGFVGAGSAIILDNNESYGNMSMDIKGDTYVASVAGYAVQELVTSGIGEIAASDIHIDGGTFIGGKIDEEGHVQAITFTENVATDVKQNGSISNAIINSLQDAQNLVNTEGDGVITPIETATGTIYVVSEVPSDVKETKTSDLANATEGAYVVINGDGSYTLTADKDLYSLTIDADYTVTVPNGIVLKAGQIILGNDAKLIVEVGGKVLITGKGGVMAQNANNIVLNATSDGMGMLLLNPNVTANPAPWATVNYTCKGYTYEGYKLYDIFSSPFKTITSIQSNVQGGVATYYQYFIDGQGWKACETLEEVFGSAVPFKSFAISNEKTTPGVIYTIKGQLQGNIVGELTLAKGWNYLGNGYTGSMKVSEIANKLKAQGADVKSGLLIWDTSKQIWEKYVSGMDESIKAMSAFALYSNTEDANIVLDYNSLVWQINQ